jgi:hypothetical protein
MSKTVGGMGLVESDDRAWFDGNSHQDTPGYKWSVTFVDGPIQFGIKYVIQDSVGDDEHYSSQQDAIIGAKKWGKRFCVNIGEWIDEEGDPIDE